MLKATAATGAAAVVVPGITAGCASDTAADGSGSSASASAARALSEMSGSEKSPPAKLTGRVVRPEDPDYASASLGWDELFVHYPLVIVFAQETQDVVNALTERPPQPRGLAERR